MKPSLAVSNIAWAPEEDGAAYALLRGKNVMVLEAAPGRLFKDPANVSVAEAAEVQARLGAYSIRPFSFQAILFGKPELGIFVSADARKRCLEYLGALARTASLVDARVLVFGAPKNRWIPDGMSADEAQAVAFEFFSALAAVGEQHRVVFTLEPNPAAYGCNFLTNLTPALEFVSAVARPGLALQLDTGALAMNGERVEEEISSELMRAVGHVHVSQPHLEDFSKPWDGHAEIARLLKSVSWTGPISIEMKRSQRGLVAVEEAVDFVRACYGTE